MVEVVSKVRDKSELRRRRDVEEAVRVAEDDYRRRRSQEEEETSSSVQSSVEDELHSFSAKTAKGEILRPLRRK